MRSFATLVGNRIRELRKQSGLRQEDMEDFGLNYRYFQDIEAGKANITLATLEKIAHALKVKPEYLLAVPLAPSPEGAELIAEIEKIFLNEDQEAIRKLLVVVKEVI